MTVLLQAERVAPIDADSPAAVRDALRADEGHVLPRPTADRGQTASRATFPGHAVAAPVPSPRAASGGPTAP